MQPGVPALGPTYSSGPFSSVSMWIPVPASASLTGWAGIAFPGMITDKYYCCVCSRCLSAEVIASLRGRVSADRSPHLTQPQQGSGKWW